MSDCFKIGAEVLGNNKRRQGWKGIVTDIFTNGKTKKRIKYTVRWKNGQSTDEYSQSLSLPELDSVGRPRRVYDSEMLEEAELLTSAASIPIHLPVPSTTSEGTTRTGRATASNNDIGGY